MASETSAPLKRALRSALQRRPQLEHAWRNHTFFDRRSLRAAAGVSPSGSGVEFQLLQVARTWRAQWKIPIEATAALRDALANVPRSLRQELGVLTAVWSRGTTALLSLVALEIKRGRSR
ncbi:hypothetical protein PG996_012901 [Apiospora saccharicola]|uniref:Uncharacterized protein n=1 Tax=Apiospora saccharicola TaxID=335842 RepID=A0ABR1U6D7_9PEZI